MMTAFNDQNELTNVKVTNKGELKVSLSEGTTTENGFVKTTSGETTLLVDNLSIGSEAQEIAINKYVTEIELANYSETAKLTVAIGDIEATIGESIVTSFPINAEVENISITSTEENSKVQIIVKGVKE